MDKQVLHVYKALEIVIVLFRHKMIIYNVPSRFM